MPTTDLMSALVVSSATFTLAQRKEFSRQAGGSPREADLGPPIWTAKIGVGPMPNDDAEAAAALIDKMQCDSDTFYVWNPRRQYPRMDPDGSILGSNTVTIYALDADTRYLRLAGLPVGYKISIGDFLSWDQGSSPVHRCLHRFVGAATADSNGRIPLTAVVPHIKAGASTGLTVSLKRPAAEMMILPGSYDFPSSGATASSISFTAIQIP